MLLACRERAPAMAPPVFLTTGREASPPPSPSTARALEQWLGETFDAALFETQQGRFLRFVRVERQASVGVALVLAKSREPSAEDEVLVPVAALGEVGVPPCIAKVYLFLFDVPVHGTSGEVTAKRTRADGDSISKIIVSRAPVEGSGTARANQSTLTVASFFSQISHKLSQTSLSVQTAVGSGGTQGARPHVASWANFPNLADLARAADVFQSAEPVLSWADAEEFLSAALNMPVSGRPAVLGAAARLDSRLATQTSVRTAVAAAVDAARETHIELTMKDKGAIVAAQGVPAADTSPAARPQPAPAAAALAAPAARPARDAPGEPEAEEQGDDSESSGSSESYETDTESASDRPARKRKRKRGRHDKRKKKRKRKKSKPSRKEHRRHRQGAPSSAHETFSPGADLAKLTPAGMRASQVAKVLFSNPTLSKAAQYDECEPESGDDGEGVAQRRTAFAVRRLTAMYGTSWIPDEPVASAADLRNVREHAAHLVASRGAGTMVASGSGAQLAQGCHGAGPSSNQGRPIDVDADDRTVTLSTGAAPLASEQQVGAVLPDVVERLHAHGAQLAYTPGEDVGAGIRSAPENLRTDLARAVGSNGKVDATGERKSTRCTMPSVVMRMYSTLVEEVHEALRMLPTEDESGSQHMSMKAARKLAEASVWGYFHVSDYIKEVGRTFSSRNSPKSGSLEELQHAWRYIREALLTTASALYDMKATDAGVTKVDARLGSVVNSLRLDVYDVRVWLGRVLESWERAVARFRRGRPEVPSFAECIAAHEEFFRLLSFTASMSLRSESGRRDKRNTRSRGEEGGGGSSRSRSRRGRVDKSSDEDDGDSSDKPKTASRGSRGSKPHKSKRSSLGRGSGGDGKAKKTSTAASAWPDKPRMSAEQFEAFKTEVREKCGDSCNFFLVTSCKREDCKYSHDIPPAFLEIRAKYAA